MDIDNDPLISPGLYVMDFFTQIYWLWILVWGGGLLLIQAILRSTGTAHSDAHSQIPLDPAMLAYFKGGSWGMAYVVLVSLLVKGAIVDDERHEFLRAEPLSQGLSDIETAFYQRFKEPKSLFNRYQILYEPDLKYLRRQWAEQYDAYLEEQGLLLSKAAYQRKKIRDYSLLTGLLLLPGVFHFVYSGLILGQGNVLGVIPAIAFSIAVIKIWMWDERRTASGCAYWTHVKDWYKTERIRERGKTEPELMPYVAVFDGLNALKKFPDWRYDYIFRLGKHGENI